LQGEDLFLEDLSEAYRTRVLSELRRHVSDCDGFVATSEYYARAMQEMLAIPRADVRTTPIGISLHGFEARFEPPGPPWRIGYLARIAPE
jgi:hypothetical protein